MILNDLPLLGTKIEVWKEYLKMLPNASIYEGELSSMLLKDINAENLYQLEMLIKRFEQLDLKELQDEADRVNQAYLGS